jgi:hypothetical protein
MPQVDQSALQVMRSAEMHRGADFSRIKAVVALITMSRRLFIAVSKTQITRPTGQSGDLTAEAGVDAGK